ncbi:MAG: YqxA family protein [Bacillaceae bacterium]|nr:YqxA family protein [Bacillaceae bacterium]
MMKRFMLKCTFIAFVLFLGVLFGMQQANVGMQKMKGYDDPSFSNSVFRTTNNEGFQSSLHGTNLTSQDIRDKQKKLEEIKTFNAFSSMGKKLAGSVSQAVDKAIKDTTEKVEDKMTNLNSNEEGS